MPYKDPEKARARDRAYRTSHKKEIANRGGAYRASHKKETADRGRAYYVSHKEKIANRGRAYRASHKEKIAARGKARYASHKKEYAVSSRTGKLRKYGLTPETFKTMLTGQGGVCAICGAPDWGRNGPIVDHNHRTNKIRGILCNGCNSVLGHSKEDPRRLRAAIKYLEENQ